jgi:hypothetical protein
MTVFERLTIPAIGIAAFLAATVVMRLAGWLYRRAAA